MKKVTFDTTSRPDEYVVRTALAAGWYVTYASVSFREAEGTDFDIKLEKHNLIPELAVWNESVWDGARWADKQSSERIERILAIISNGAFPKNRSKLTRGQIHQLRDAMILEAHTAAGHDAFVTNDAKAFIKNGRREKLQTLLGTRILTPEEFAAELSA